MKHVDPMGGYLRGMHINWGVPLRGVTVWGVISGGVILRAPFMAPARQDRFATV